MSDIPSPHEVDEMWKQYIRNSATDLIMREMVAMLDADEVTPQNSRRRSGPRKYRDREREKGHDRLVRDYFCDEPIYDGDLFRRRFRIRRDLFVKIVDAMRNCLPFFTLRQDTTGRNGLSPLQSAPQLFDSWHMRLPVIHLMSTCGWVRVLLWNVYMNFCKSTIVVYGDRYLRTPNTVDTERLLQMHEERHGFPGMLGSLDCMHWEWRNCPVAYKGYYTRGDHGVPTIVLEAVALADLWIWHAFFGVAGASNDINVLHESPLFNQFLQGNAPPVQFMVNGRMYNKGYYLTDGIYPTWASFVKSYPAPGDPVRRKFAQRQEAVRKDVERAFGVLQARWAVVRNPAQSYFKEDLRNIMLTCIILHNMIIEDEGEEAVNWSDEDATPQQPIPMETRNWLMIGGTLTMKLAEKLPSMLNKDPEFKTNFDNIVWSDYNEPNVFEEHWQNMIDEYDLADNRWFSDMFEDHTFWIPAYFKDVIQP
ncbi:uncharacterized protein LOC130998259 [Salvia miltiorrhiza]|uniref:uncharacterized protein LOC130998259 n=1 Tax=Salvia miltiorrhiza TaxID=226208 RepID=UPI0025AC3250|nr:uncharacterized protein LOC130998259 [Salvia miltiorrhiza]